MCPYVTISQKIWALSCSESKPWTLDKLIISELHFSHLKNANNSTYCIQKWLLEVYEMIFSVQRNHVTYLLKKKSFNNTSVAFQITCKCLDLLLDALKEDPKLFCQPSLLWFLYTFFYSHQKVLLPFFHYEGKLVVTTIFFSFQFYWDTIDTIHI